MERNGIRMETKTIRLFDGDAYATQFTARVVSCIKKEERYEVILDRTLFFPEEGGQSSDKGTINGMDVEDVQITDGIIRHILKEPLTEIFTEGMEVSGKLDWEHRFSNMQQHSGEHLFSGAVHRLFGYDNVGFHLSDNIVTMDFSGVLTYEDAIRIEEEVNRIITENIVTKVSYPSKEELEALSYRSKIEIEGEVRIVTFPGYDCCACCAPHVKRTGEIGLLKVMSLQNYKGGSRLSILCGFRALRAFRKKAEILKEVSEFLCTSEETLGERIRGQKKEIQDLKLELSKANAERMKYITQSLSEKEKNPILFESNLDNYCARETINSLVEKRDGICGIFVGTEGEGYHFILGSNKDDCRNFLTFLKENMQVRGGGNAEMVQGFVQSEEMILRQLWKEYHAIKGGNKR